MGVGLGWLGLGWVCVHRNSDWLAACLPGGQGGMHSTVPCLPPLLLLRSLKTLPPPAPSHLPRPAASNIFSLAQSALLKVPFVKKLVGLPDLSALKKGGAKAAADAAAGKPVVTFAQRPTPAVQAAAAAAPEQQPEPAAATAAPKPVTHRRRPARARK